MNEYRVKVTVRNNLLLTAIEDAGYASQSDFARSAGLSPTDVNALVAMRLAPINSHGEFRDAAKVIMEVLGASPQDLWTDKQLMLELERNTGERTVSEIAVQSILENHVQQMTLPDPEDTAFEGERSRLIDAALNSLSPREAHVIRLRFERDMPFDDVAKDIGVTRERARQIEAKALRKLRDKRHKLHEVNS